MHVLLYSALSTLATCSVLGNAYSSPPSARAITEALFRSKLSVLVLVNMAFNLLFLFAKLTQHVFFGKLRVIESQMLYDRLLHYVLFKIVFAGAVLEPDLKEILVWTTWFTIFGFLRVFAHLTRARFEYLTFTPNTPLRTHLRLIVLLTLLFLSDVFWFYFCVNLLSHDAGLSVLLLLSFECVILFIEVVHTGIKYGIHIWDLLHPDSTWEAKATYIYYVELFCEVLSLSISLAHHIHIWSLHGVSFTLIDAVLFLNMRHVFNALKRKLLAYRNYRLATLNLDQRYPTATPEDIAAFNDDCAICWDKMSSAKKLPCGHLFHLACLRSCLEHNNSCPTCRRSLADPESPQQNGSASQAQATTADGRPQAAGQAGPTFPGDLPQARPRQEETSLFHFSSDRWGWLPSFSLEVVRRTNFTAFGHAPALPLAPGPNAAPPQPIRPSHTAQPSRYSVSLEMVRQIQEMFPFASASGIAEDLSRTGSMEVTIENVLEGRILSGTAQPMQPATSSDPYRASTSSSFASSLAGSSSQGQQAAFQTSASGSGPSQWPSPSTPEPSLRRDLDVDCPPARSHQPSQENTGASSGFSASPAGTDADISRRRTLAAEAAQRRMHALTR